MLKGVDTIFAEDCRHTRKLTSHYGITTPLISYHAHNEAKRESTLLQLLARALPVALVSDAGTPGVSDPGASAVSAAVAAGHTVVPIPGPSAVVTALAASGLPTDAFLFVGFLPPRSAQRKKQLETLRSRITVRVDALHVDARRTTLHMYVAYWFICYQERQVVPEHVAKCSSTCGAVHVQATMVIYVPPHSLCSHIDDMVNVFGPDRNCCVARELTKIYETFVRGTLREAQRKFAEDPPRGEVTLLLAGSTEDELLESARSDVRFQNLLQDVPAVLHARARTVQSHTCVAHTLLHNVGP